MTDFYWEGCMPDEFFHGVARAIQHLHQGKDRNRPEEAQIGQPLALLRTWQSERLSRTYADLLETPRYRLACQFFLDDVYAARDFRGRDHDIEQLYQLAERFIPAHFLVLFKALFDLNQMTNQLDAALLQTLLEKLDLQDTLTAEMYAQAYRLCDNYADRKYQIELLAAIIHDVGRGVRDPLVWPTLKLAKVPASLGGWNEIYEFSVKGYEAFRSMRHPDVFAQTIQRREMKILDNIFAGAPDPFKLEKE